MDKIVLTNAALIAQAQTMPATTSMECVYIVLQLVMEATKVIKLTKVRI